MANSPATPQNTSRVQVRNPFTGHWVKVDTRSGRIVDTKKTPGPYRNIPQR